MKTRLPEIIKLLMLLAAVAIFPVCVVAEEETRLNPNAIPKMVADTILESCRAHPAIRALSISAAQTAVNRCAYRVLNYKPVADLTRAIITTEVFRQFVEIIYRNRFESALSYGYAKKELNEHADPELVEMFERVGEDQMVSEEEEQAMETLKEQAPYQAGEVFSFEGWLRSARFDEEMSYAAIRNFIAITPPHISALPPSQRQRYLEEDEDREEERLQNSPLLRMLKDPDRESSFEQPAEVEEASTVYKGERERIKEWRVIEVALLKELVDDYVNDLSFD